MSGDWGDFEGETTPEGAQNPSGRPEAPVEGYGDVLAALEAVQELLGAGEDPTPRLARLAAAVGAAAAAEAAAANKPMYYAQLDQFVENYLVRVYRRDLELPSYRWCPEWWMHAEAIARLEAMWRAWEQLRWDGPQGGSTWWLNHADPHMRVLLSDEGPFRHCRRGAHAAAEERLVDLPSKPAPAGMFKDR